MAIAKVTQVIGGSDEHLADEPNPQIATMPAVAAGNRVVVFGGVWTSMVDTRGNTYVKRTGSGALLTESWSAIIRTPLQAGDTITLTRAPTSNGSYYHISVWSGIDTGAPFYDATTTFVPTAFHGDRITSLSFSLGAVPRNGSLVMIAWLLVNSYDPGPFPHIGTTGGWTNEAGLSTSLGGGGYHGYDWQWKICNQSESYSSVLTNFTALTDTGYYIIVTYQPPQLLYGGL